MARSEKEISYFYKVKLFIKEYLIATNEVIRNSINTINSLGILKDRQEKKDDRNQELSVENSEKKSLEAPDNPIIIFDKEENTNILDLKLKKFISFS